MRPAWTLQQWHVTYFFDTGTDETTQFTGYVFDFDSNNIFTASNGSNNYMGHWSVKDDDRSIDNVLDDIDFNITFTNPPDFEDLTEHWQIISQSATKIELRNTSGGNGGTRLLTFERI